MYVHTYTVFQIRYVLILDVIISLKLCGLAGLGGDICNLQTSLSPNDLSKFNDTNDPLQSAADVFTRMQVNQFGPKGSYLRILCMHFCISYSTVVLYHTGR